jgi:predicted trehalose synthase
MSRQRWYANKGAAPELVEIARYQLPSREPGVVIVTHLVADRAPTHPTLYQVPLTYRLQPLPAPAQPIAEVAGLVVYDGPRDPAYTSALLELVLESGTLEGERMTVTGHAASGPFAASLRGAELISHVLGGDQSNTSIVFEPRAGVGPSVICKLFRGLQAGENPDVVLQTALAAAGSRSVPRPAGHIAAHWHETGDSDALVSGHLAFAQEFLAGSRDGWRIAREAAAAGIDFSTEARALGVATARVHETLARAMPTTPTTKDDSVGVIAQMHGRLAAALAEVPALGLHGPALRDVFGHASRAAWPPQQRIHGDLHLGQVLLVPGRGWVIVDFEGEPLRPMAERTRLDSPLRDVAGMLRSFDYVGGSLGVTGSIAETREWVTAARRAFEEGYGEASGSDLVANRALIDAFEIDKALYETVYEARNRPDWLGIPVAAIERIALRPEGY